MKKSRKVFCVWNRLENEIFWKSHHGIIKTNFLIEKYLKLALILSILHKINQCFISNFVPNESYFIVMEQIRKWNFMENSSRIHKNKFSKRKIPKIIIILSILHKNKSTFHLPHRSTQFIFPSCNQQGKKTL